MKIKKALCILLILAAVACNNMYAPAAVSASETGDNGGTFSWPEAPETVSGSVILIDADTGAILYQKNPHIKSYPASTTKILTGLLTIENCSMDEIVTFSDEAANSVAYGDASIGTKPGEQYTVEQALYALLLHSANELGYGLAEHVSGSLDAFLELMNERARELGAINTHFANASGLHDDNHYTTAYDMAMIARGCYNNATFVNIDSTYSTYTIPPTNMTDEPRYIRHRHQMLKGRPYYYEYCKGGKTGFTDEAGNTLVTFAEKGDMRLICVCFQSTDTDRYTDTRSLFDWGFANFKKVTASSGSISSLFSDSNYYKSNVFAGNSLRFHLNASTLTIPNDASVNDVTLDIDDNYAASVSDDTYTAHLHFMYGSNTVGAVTLTISSAGNESALGNLPYKNDTAGENAPEAKKELVVSLWVIAAAGIAMLIIAYIFSEIRRTKRRKLYARKKHTWHY